MENLKLCESHFRIPCSKCLSTFNPDVTYFSPERVLTRSPPFILYRLNIAAATVCGFTPRVPPLPRGQRADLSRAHVTLDSASSALFLF